MADTFTVAVTGRAAAPAATVYRLIADYREGHPRIVPPKYFRNLEVEQGGYGAGTTIRFEMTVLGSTRQAEAVVSEPDPGRVLVERELRSGIVTTFIVEPIGEAACNVTISSEVPRRPGLAGTIERFITARILPRSTARNWPGLRRVPRRRHREVEEPGAILGILTDGPRMKL